MIGGTRIGESKYAKTKMLARYPYVAMDRVSRQRDTLLRALWSREMSDPVDIAEQQRDYEETYGTQEQRDADKFNHDLDEERDDE